MDHKTYASITGVIFAAIAVLQALRLIYNWNAVIAGWHVPVALSWLAIFVAGFLAYQAYRLRGRG